VFTSPGVLAAEDNAGCASAATSTQPVRAQLTSYAGGVAAFLARPDYAQQCFVFSEPIVVRRQDPRPTQDVPRAESGYNPYTTVVITAGETLRTHPDRVRAMAEACREGWRAYLDDPATGQQDDGELNTDMHPEVFAEGAKAQRPLIETEETQKLGLGGMTAERWTDARPTARRARRAEARAAGPAVLRRPVRPSVISATPRRGRAVTHAHVTRRVAARRPLLPITD
jgi:hypothetical protein